MADFIDHITNSPGETSIKHIGSHGLWTVQAGYRAQGSAGNRVKWGTNRIGAIDLVDKALNLQMTIYDPGKEEGSRIVNEKETLAARAKLEELHKHFGSGYRTIRNAKGVCCVNTTTYTIRAFVGGQMEAI